MNESLFSQLSTRTMPIIVQSTQWAGRQGSKSGTNSCAR